MDLCDRQNRYLPRAGSGTYSCYDQGESKSARQCPIGTPHSAQRLGAGLNPQATAGAGQTNPDLFIVRKRGSLVLVK